MTPSRSDLATDGSSAPPDRLDVGPGRRRPGRGLRRRVVRGGLAAVTTALVLVLVSVVAARGWRPPPVLPALGVQPEAAVAPWDRHLPYAFVDRAEASTAAGARVRTVRPRGAEGTIPGIVLVDGEGRTARDDLADEAEALARGGLAVATYDGRTEGFSPFRRDADRPAEDALGALDVVARQPGVDRDRVGLLGYGDGGRVVARAAALVSRSAAPGRPAPVRVAFTVLVSAPVVSRVDQASWVADRALGATPALVRSAAAAFLATGRPLVDRLGADDRPPPAATGVPTYAVWGAADRTVPVTVAVERFRTATGGSGRAEVVPAAGHRVPVASGWAERVSDWVRRGYPGDTAVRGAEPDVLAGLPTLPEPGPTADLRLDLAVVALAALVAACWPLRGAGRRPAVRTARWG